MTCGINVVNVSFTNSSLFIFMTQYSGKTTVVKYGIKQLEMNKMKQLKK